MSGTLRFSQDYVEYRSVLAILGTCQFRIGCEAIILVFQGFNYTSDHSPDDCEVLVKIPLLAVFPLGQIGVEIASNIEQIKLGRLGNIEACRKSIECK